MIDIDDIREITINSIADDILALKHFIAESIYCAARAGKLFTRISKNKRICQSAYIVVLSELIQDGFTIKKSKDYYYILWVENFIADKLRISE